MKFNTISFCIILLVGCDEFGSDKKFPMSEGKRYQFKMGDILTYQSVSATETFEVIQVVNGEYSDSQSGTCGKPRLYVYEYQAIYLKPTDSLTKDYLFVQNRTNDCTHYPQFYEKRLIAAINGSYNEENADRLTWLDEYDIQISKFQSYHPTWANGSQTFQDVYEYHVGNGKRVAKLFYTRPFGFVGYELKDGSLFVLKK